MSTSTNLTPDASTLRPVAHKPRRHRRRIAVRWGKRIGLGLAAGLTLAGLVNAFLPSPVGVDVGVVSRRPLDVEIAEDGQTRVRDRFVVTAPISGELERLTVEAGAEVAQGAVLAQIRPPRPMLLDERSRSELSARLALSRAHERQAATSIARATLARDAGVRDANRARGLVAQGAITVQELERTELAERIAIEDLRSAGLQRTAAAAEVAQVLATLQDGRDSTRVAPVTAPSSGRVLRVIRESAGPVAAGSPLLELGDIRALEVVVDVLSSDAARIAPGMPIQLDSGTGQPISGRVRLVEPSAFTRVSALGVEEQRVNVVATIDEPPASIGDGFRVDARIIIWHTDQTLVVPASALFRDGDRWAVFAVEDSRARLRRVEIGHRGRFEVELSGLDAGSQVIVHPTDRIADGVRVEPRGP
jgi:HlyD family secretion protein